MSLLVISPHSSSSSVILSSYIWAVGRCSGRYCWNWVRGDAVPTSRTPTSTFHILDIFSWLSDYIHTVQKRQPATTEATAADAAIAAERSLPELGRTPLGPAGLLGKPLELVGVLGKPLDLVGIFWPPFDLLGLFGTPWDPDWLLNLPLLLERPPSFSPCCFRRFTGETNWLSPSSPKLLFLWTEQSSKVSCSSPSWLLLLFFNSRFVLRPSPEPLVVVVLAFLPSPVYACIESFTDSMSLILVEQLS